MVVSWLVAILGVVGSFGSLDGPGSGPNKPIWKASWWQSNTSRYHPQVTSGTDSGAVLVKTCHLVLEAGLCSSDFAAKMVLGYWVLTGQSLQPSMFLTKLRVSFRWILRLYGAQLQIRMTASL